MNDSCPQCGARLHAGTTCAERLYRMVASGGIEHERMGEAFAQFALSHPMTYSSEALQAASDLLVARGVHPVLRSQMRRKRLKARFADGGAALRDARAATESSSQAVGSL